MSSILNFKVFRLLTMTTLQDRIREALDKAKMKPVDLAKLCGVERATVSFWMRGETKNMKGDNLTRAARALRIDPHWLATGERSPNSAIIHAKETNTSAEYRLLQKFNAMTEEDQDRTIAIIDVFLKHEHAARDLK
jgi:transcriptional regulator with XRE-family HTH domain